METVAQKTKKPQLHISAIQMMERCGEQFRRRYIEKHIIAPGVALIVGGATDSSVNKNLTAKIQTGQLLEIEEIKSEARDKVINAFNGEIRLSDEEVKNGLKKVKSEAVDKAVRLSVLHAKTKAIELQPTHVQRPWTVDLEGYPVSLAGTIDIQEGQHSVRDTKTSGKTPAGDIAEKSDQLTMYAMAAKVIDGQMPQQVALDYLIDNKTPIQKSFLSVRTEEDFKPLLARVETAVLAIEKGVYVPVNPDHWVCSAKWCGYWPTCRYARKPRSISLVGIEIPKEGGDAQ